MSTVFVDTSFLVAFLNPSDAHHGPAVDTFADLRATRLATTDLVIGELLGFFSRSPRRRSIAVFARNLPTVSGVEVVAVGPRLFRAGIDLYIDRSDKQWSLVDCVSFVIMREQRIRRALTTDHHFRQAGFDAMLA